MLARHSYACGHVRDLMAAALGSCVDCAPSLCAHRMRLPARRGATPAPAAQAQGQMARRAVLAAASSAGGSSDGDAPTALAEEMVSWSSLHGLLVGLDGTQAEGCAACHAPVSLLPTAFPAAAFRRAKAAARDFNLLVDAVSQDHEYLVEALVDTGTLEGDEFTRRVWGVYEAARKADAQTHGRAGGEADAASEAKPKAKGARRAPLVLGIHRSDYMVDGESGALLQVEMNTISVSFASLGSLVARAHRHLVERFAPRGYTLDRMPESASLDAPADALAAAWSAYQDVEAVVLFIVQPGERNAYDQRWIADQLWARHGVPAVRATLADVAADGILDSASGALTFRGKRVAVAYFRAGYGPGDYPTDNEWEARRTIELADCAKCPSAAYQLVGTKRVQQHLAAPGNVERFLDADAAARVRATFAGLWSLLDEEGQEAATAALADPSAFVLKPQREGGGNNMYGEEMAAKLRDLLSHDATDGERGAYVLMQRIRPPVQRATLLREGMMSEDQEVLSELGIFSTFLRDGENVVLNAEGGSLLRTKQATSDEGGVAAGFAVLDSPILSEPM